MIGYPRVHLRETGSTNDRARALAAAGAPHGTLVTAARQTGGRGRQGRAWSAPAGALALSLLVRAPGPLLSLAAGVAVAGSVGPDAGVKWPNDVLVDGDRKVAGILVEGRPVEGWAVVGIGVNVAVSLADLPPPLRSRAATLGLGSGEIEDWLARLLAALDAALALPDAAVLSAFRARDALRGRDVSWATGSGRADGVDEQGRLRVLTAAGEQVLAAGEVHLGAP